MHLDCVVYVCILEDLKQELNIALSPKLVLDISEVE